MAYKNIPPFHIADYILFVAFIVLSLTIGLYHGIKRIKQNTTSEYLLGNKQLNVWPVAVSLVVSFESSIMMLGLPAEAYLYGIQYGLYQGIGWCASCVISTVVFVPMLYDINLRSVYEYLEKRFHSTAVRLLGNALQTLYYIIYMGIVLFGPATAMEAVMGFPIWASILGIGAVATIYTSVGGIRAVVWTDFLQGFVMLAGIFAVLIKGTMVVGGVDEVIRRNQKSGRLDFNFNPDPRIRLTFWTLCVGFFIRYFGIVFNQASFQRISSLPKKSAAQWVYFISGLGFLMFSFCASIEGLVGYAYFDYKGCDPVASGQLRNSNQMIILMVLELFESTPGVTGMFLAALFSASLSTLSSGMGSVSTIFWEDVLKPRVGEINEGNATIIVKVTVVFCGILSVGVAFLVAEVGGTLAEMCGLIMGAATAPLTGLILMATLCPFVRSKPALIGTIVGTIIIIWLTTGQMMSKHLAVSYRLPPASVNQCESLTTTTNNTLNMSSTSLFTNGDETTAIYKENNRGLGYKEIYVMSPYVYSPIGTLLTIVAILLASIVLGKKNKHKPNSSFVAACVARLRCCKLFIAESFAETESMDNKMHVQYNTVEMDDMAPDIYKINATNG